MNITITTPSDREIAITRQFNAPRALVFKAMSTPELIKRWLVGTPGWVLAVCEVDARAGGAYRYVWKKNDTEMGMGGVFLEFSTPERWVGTEKVDNPWYEGECIGTTVLTEDAGRTTMTLTLRYDSKSIRDAVLKSGMERGLEHSYNLLADVVTSAS